MSDAPSCIYRTGCTTPAYCQAAQRCTANDAAAQADAPAPLPADAPLVSRNPAPDAAVACGPAGHSQTMTIGVAPARDALVDAQIEALWREYATVESVFGREYMRFSAFAVAVREAAAALAQRDVPREPTAHTEQITRLAMAVSDGDRPILPALWQAYELGQAPSTCMHGGDPATCYEIFGGPVPNPTGAQPTMVDLAWRLVRAQGNMLQKWAEADDTLKKGLWRNLHSAGDALRAALEAAPEESDAQRDDDARLREQAAYERGYADGRRER